MPLEILHFAFVLFGRRAGPGRTEIAAWHERYKYEREHAHEGPMFGYVKRAHPRADDADIKQAISEAVKFYDDCSHYFKWGGDFWARVVRAVAQAQNKHPFYLDATYRDARNHLAYLMK